MEYSSRIFVPNISAEYFRRNAIKKKEKVVNLVHLLPGIKRIWSSDLSVAGETYHEIEDGTFCAQCIFEHNFDASFKNASVMLIFYCYRPQTKFGAR